jgi:hypothetical protein
MALWGNNDNVLTASAGIITASGFNGEVLGTGTTFTNYTVGQTLTLGVGQTAGFGVIKSITSNTELQMHDDLGGSLDELVQTYTGSTDSFIVGDRPISATSDPKFAPTSSNAQRGYTSKVYGVNASIQQVRQATDSKFTPTHAGWVGVTTYVDNHGNLRVKSETLVAMSGISTNTQAVAAVLPA